MFFSERVPKKISVFLRRKGNPTSTCALADFPVVVVKITFMKVVVVVKITFMKVRVLPQNRHRLFDSLRETAAGKELPPTHTILINYQAIMYYHGQL